MPTLTLYERMIEETAMRLHYEWAYQYFIRDGRMTSRWESLLPALQDEYREEAHQIYDPLYRTQIEAFEAWKTLHRF